MSRAERWVTAATTLALAALAFMAYRHAMSEEDPAAKANLLFICVVNSVVVAGVAVAWARDGIDRFRLDWQTKRRRNELIKVIRARLEGK